MIKLLPLEPSTQANFKSLVTLHLHARLSKPQPCGRDGWVTDFTTSTSEGKTTDQRFAGPKTLLGDKVTMDAMLVSHTREKDGANMDRVLVTEGDGWVQATARPMVV